MTKFERLLGNDVVVFASPSDIVVGFDVRFDRDSTPSRQLTFHREISDAIAERDRLLLFFESLGLI